MFAISGAGFLELSVFMGSKRLKMAEITAQLVKELRDKTGAGMMDCKKALNETDADMDAAANRTGSPPKA